MITKAKLSGILFGLTALFAVLHNMLSTILGNEEPLFLILALLFAFVFVIYTGVTLIVFTYNAIKHQIRKKRRVH